MSDLYLSDIEVKAEVYRIVRANMYYSKKEILEMIKGHLSGIEMSRIQNALKELGEM